MNDLDDIIVGNQPNNTLDTFDLQCVIINKSEDKKAVKGQ